MQTVVPVTLVIGENTLDVELEMTVLRGTVRDRDGNPVGGATVTVGPAPTDTPTGAAAVAGIALETVMPVISGWTSLV